MTAAAHPANEAERLKALVDLGILDTGAEQEFDALVQAAALVCDVPVSLLSLVDAERQWFKAAIGVEETETPRELAFCAHAIHGDDILEINDATADPRFSDNALVTGSPDIRFYAGAPLRLADGSRIGTLCVIDRKPRRLDGRQRAILSHLAQAAVRAMELRRDALARAESEARMRALGLQMKALSDQLALENERKNHFLAALAHELRGPMGAMSNGLQLMQLDPDASVRTRKTVGMMERQISQMVKLVNDLLDVGRIGAGKIELAIQPVDLGTVIARSLETVLPLVEARHQELSFDLARDPLHLMADADRLVQVVSNLLGNAAKYTPEYGRIAVSSRAEGGEAVLEISDNGIGIAPGAIGGIFGLFQQVESGRKLSQGGLGIGLSLVKQLTELHGGTVTAASEGDGKGSRFTVRLPLATHS